MQDAFHDVVRRLEWSAMLKKKDEDVGAANVDGSCGHFELLEHRLPKVSLREADTLVVAGPSAFHRYLCARRPPRNKVLLGIVARMILCGANIGRVSANKNICDQLFNQLKLQYCHQNIFTFAQLVRVLSSNNVEVLPVQEGDLTNLLAICFQDSLSQPYLLCFR